MIVILSLVCQILADAAVLPMPLLWFTNLECRCLRFSSPLASSSRCCCQAANKASGAVVLIYIEAVILAVESSHSASGCLGTLAFRPLCNDIGYSVGSIS